MFLRGQNLAEVCRQTAEKQSIEKDVRFATRGQQIEHLVHHLRGSPVSQGRMIQKGVEHLVGARQGGLQQPVLELRVWISRRRGRRGTRHHCSQGLGQLRRNPGENMVELGGGAGDLLNAELRLGRLEPHPRVVDPEQG